MQGNLSMLYFRLPADDATSDVVRQFTNRIATTLNRRTDQILRDYGITTDNAADYYGRVEIVDHSANLADREAYREIFVDNVKIGEVKVKYF